jgi:5-oxoprolinase (ATP-hydrolysing) subunit A
VDIDLNCDLGEGYGVWAGGPDEALLPLISSANVACGAYAGDPTIMRRTCQLAVRRGVIIGAQVGYPDREGFGRRFLDIDPADLANSLIAQIGALSAIAHACGTSVRYVKPHGMLYNTIVHHEAQATAVVAAIADLGTGVPLLGLPGSAVQRIAERRAVPFIVEGFADRRYTTDGTLVPRSDERAMLDTMGEVQAQVVRLAASGVRTVCVHSDSPSAVAIAGWARQALLDTGYAIVPFAI